jgi:Uma2 family endonuclease
MALELPDGLWAYDDYAALDDGHRYQVVDGVLVSSPSPSSLHQELLRRLSFAVSAHLANHPGGRMYFAPFDVVLRAERPGIVLQPDLMYLAPERLERATRANLQGAPNLVAEVLSPGTAMLDLTRKKSLYATYGVDEYWIVRPAERRVDVLHRTGDHFGQATTLTVGETLRCALLPGFELDLTTLFANAEDFE